MLHAPSTALRAVPLPRSPAPPLRFAPRGRISRHGALNAALVSQLSLAGSGAGGAAQGCDRAQGLRVARLLRAHALARRRLLVGAACPGNRGGDRVHSAGRRARPRRMAGARIRRGARQAGEVAGFPLVVVLLEGQTAPGLPFLRRLHWIISPDPASEKDVARLFDAASGGGSSPGELWRYTSPYRGLAAMEEKDSDYFFGRKRETVEVLSALAGAPDRLPVLIGNSGVGKSSLAQAGVLAALKRQAWPEEARAPNAWPAGFSGQPPMVLSLAQARHRSAQGVGGVVPRHLAVRCNRSRTGEASEWLDRAVAATARRRCPI